jgi:hypothetical protein
MTFDEWIASTFGHPVTEPKWYWDTADGFWDGPAATIVGYMARLFAEADNALSPFSEAQAAQGLHAVAANGPTEYAFLLLDTTVPLRSRLDCIGAMEALFRHYLARRCTPHLSHLDRIKTPDHVSPLNGVCYMWWDVLPLHGLSRIRPDHPDGPELDHAIFTVIRRCLEIDSVACQESALLGLMQWSPYYDEAGDIAEDFLSRNPDIWPELRAFALRVS